MVDRRRVPKNYIAKVTEITENDDRLKNVSSTGGTIRSSLQQSTLSISDLKPIELLYHRSDPNRKSGNSRTISGYAYDYEYYEYSMIISSKIVSAKSKIDLVINSIVNHF